MRSPEHVINEIIEQSDIVSIISEHTSLNKRGSSYVGLCPFHNEKTPSFTVSQDKGLYYCFGCGAGGNVVTFLMQKENLTFTETIKELASRAHIKLDNEYMSEEEINNAKKKAKLYEVLTEAGKYFHYCLRHDERAYKYFTDRALTKDTIVHFGLGYSRDSYNDLYEYLSGKGYTDDILAESGLFVRGKNNPNKLYDRFSGRVMYPIFDITKKVIGFGGRVLDNSLPKYLNSPENILFNKSRNLYGMQFAKQTKSSYFILVEGYMDVISMHQAGFTQAVASLGTALTTGQAKLLKKYTNEVVILYDSDGAGRKAALRAIPILRTEGITVRVLTLNEGKDPDEFLKTHGSDKMQELLDNAPGDIHFRTKIIEQKFNIDQAEEKVKFLQEVAIMLADLKSSVEQSIYIKEICASYNIEEDALKAEMARAVRGITYKVEVSAPKKPKKEFSNNVLFLGALYHFPLWGAQVRKYIQPEMFEEGLLRDIASHILEHIDTGKEVDVAHFTATYTDVESQNIISHVLIYKDNRYDDTEKIKKMFIENIKRINIAYIKEQLATTTDSNKMYTLLNSMKEFESLNIDFING